MPDIMLTEQPDLPPPCPMCAGTMALKNSLRLPKHGGFMCFFHCNVCGIEFPRAVDSAKIHLADAGNNPGTDRKST